MNCWRIWSSAARDCRIASSLFQRLVETVHDAVLVHRKQILFANSRFLSLLGLERRRCRRQAPDRVRRAGICRVGGKQSAAAAGGRTRGGALRNRAAGAQGQVTRVELSSTVIDSAGEPALLLTALEMMPGAIPTASRRSRAPW